MIEMKQGLLFTITIHVRFHVASPICRAIGSSCSLI